VSRFIEEHRARFGVEPICRTLGVSASAYYQRRSGPPSDRAVRDAALLGRIREVQKESYEAYGYRRTWKELLRQGERVPRCQVQRLMRREGIQGAKRRGKPWRTTVADPQAPRRPDLLERDFTAPAPNRRWVADFTYLRCWEGLCFFAFILDVYSRMIVGWQFAAHMRDTLVIDALQMAAMTRRVDASLQLVHHSDRGSQYSSGDFAHALADHDILASVGSVGDAYDNAMAESYVDTLKTELIRDRVWRTRAQLELALVVYVGWYNNRRLHSSIGDLPPAEFEALHAMFNAGAPGSADLEEAALRAASSRPRARSTRTGPARASTKRKRETATLRRAPVSHRHDQIIRSPRNPGRLTPGSRAPTRSSLRRPSECSGCTATVPRTGWWCVSMRWARSS
jgi:putative transposase